MSAPDSSEKSYSTRDKAIAVFSVVACTAVLLFHILFGVPQKAAVELALGNPLQLIMMLVAVGLGLFAVVVSVVNGSLHAAVIDGVMFMSKRFKSKARADKSAVD